MRLAILRTILVCCAVLVAILCAEVLARLVLAAPRSTENLLTPDDGTVPAGKHWYDADWSAPPERAFRRDPVFGFEHAASITASVRIAEHRGGAYQFRTNAYGLRRDTEIAVKNPSVRRILILGDSQTSGYSKNDETYPGQLEQLWQAQLPDQLIEVLNSGVEGYSPQQMYLWHRERGAILEPDIVILAIYVGNDVSDLAYARTNGAVIDDAAGLLSPISSPVTWLSLHSHLGAHVRSGAEQQLRDPLLRIGIDTGPPVPAAGLDTLVRVLRECHGCWFQSLQQAVRARMRPDTFEQAYWRLELLIRVMLDQQASDGRQLAVLIIPTKSLVEPDDERGNVNRAARLLQLPEEDTRYDELARQRILDAANRIGVVVIDPLPDLQAAARRRRMYYRRDWHLNPDGNRAVAEAINRTLSLTALTNAPRPGQQSDTTPR